MKTSEFLKCTKCQARMFVDRVFLSPDHLELYCMRCGKREMFHPVQKYGERVQWIMQMEKRRASFLGINI
jgi:hypothetical protein